MASVRRSQQLPPHLSSRILVRIQCSPDSFHKFSRHPTNPSGVVERVDISTCFFVSCQLKLGHKPDQVIRNIFQLDQNNFSLGYTLSEMNSTLAGNIIGEYDPANWVADGLPQDCRKCYIHKCKPKSQKYLSKNASNKVSICPEYLSPLTKSTTALGRNITCLQLTAKIPVVSSLAAVADLFELPACVLHSAD